MIRQALLEHDARQGIQISLRVPGTPPFPTRQQWGQVGCEAVTDGTVFSVTAGTWHPPIGPGESGAVADRRRAAGHIRGRASQLTPAQPIPSGLLRLASRSTPPTSPLASASRRARSRWRLRAAPPSSACLRARGRQRLPLRQPSWPAVTGAFQSWWSRPWCWLLTWSAESGPCCPTWMNGKARPAATPTRAGSENKTRKTCAGAYEKVGSGSW